MGKIIYPKHDTSSQRSLAPHFPSRRLRRQQHILCVLRATDKAACHVKESQMQSTPAPASPHPPTHPHPTLIQPLSRLGILAEAPMTEKPDSLRNTKEEDSAAKLAKLKQKNKTELKNKNKKKQKRCKN